MLYVSVLPFFYLFIYCLFLIFILDKCVKFRTVIPFYTYGRYWHRWWCKNSCIILWNYRVSVLSRGCFSHGDFAYINKPWHHWYVSEWYNHLQLYSQRTSHRHFFVFVWDNRFSFPILLPVKNLLSRLLTLPNVEKHDFAIFNVRKFDWNFVF